MSTKKDYKVPSILRALDILDLIGKKKAVTLTEIYTELNIPKSSAHQILKTLESRGYIRHSGESANYSLGLALFELGNMAVSGLNIRSEAKVILRELTIKTKQTCNLAILDGTEAVILLKVEGDQHIRLNAWEGKRVPLHSTSLGKTLLAYVDEEAIDDIINKTSLTKYTQKTIIDPHELKRHLRLIKERGWALDDQENEPHVRCLGAPIRGVTGNVIASISISGLATEIDGEVLVTFSELVVHAAEKLSVRLGGKLTK